MFILGEALMKCQVCQQILLEDVEADHHLVHCPLYADMCLGCWIASVELEKFLLRATGHTPMGDWTAGWLREIVADPTRSKNGEERDSGHMKWCAHCGGRWEEQDRCCPVCKNATFIT